MPQVRPVTAQTMNYAGPIMGGVCVLSWLWYMLFWVRLDSFFSRDVIIYRSISNTFSIADIMAPAVKSPLSQRQSTTFASRSQRSKLKSPDTMRTYYCIAYRKSPSVRNLHARKNLTLASISHGIETQYPF